MGWGIIGIIIVGIIAIVAFLIKLLAPIIIVLIIFGNNSWNRIVDIWKNQANMMTFVTKTLTKAIL